MIDSACLTVFPTSCRLARCLFFEPGGRPGPGRDGFSAAAGRAAAARTLRNPRRTRAGVSPRGSAGRSQGRRRASARGLAMRSWVRASAPPSRPAGGGSWDGLDGAPGQATARPLRARRRWHGTVSTQAHPPLGPDRPRRQLPIIEDTLIRLQFDRLSGEDLDRRRPAFLRGFDLERLPHGQADARPEPPGDPVPQATGRWTWLISTVHTEPSCPTAQ